MKNWIKCMLLTMFLIVAAPLDAAAASDSQMLTVDKNDVILTVNLPEGKTDKITSLRIKLHVSVLSGTMEQPSFQFEESLNSRIKDSQIRQLEDGSYLVDLILSGKEDQDIFSGNESVKTGKLSLHPSSQEYQAKVEFASGTECSNEPVIRHVDASGLNEMSLLLDSPQSVFVKNETAEPPAEQPPAGDPSDQTPVEEAFGKKPKLKASPVKGSNSIVFEWKKVADADGYEIYQYNAKSKTYKRLKKINNPSVTAYSKKFKYAASYTFKFRAYKNKEDGSKSYGKYSSAVKVTTSPKKVTKVTLKNTEAKKSTISWKKVSNAKGYQIYRSKKKGGTYKLLKTIKKGKTTKWAVNKPKKGGVYYYKVRAYVKNAKGKRIDGKFSSVISLK